jgi:hypothetical protein
VDRRWTLGGARPNWDCCANRTEAGADAILRLVTIYQDDMGNSYRDEVTLDVDALGAATPVPTEGPRKTGTGKELDRIDLAIRTWSVHPGELRR